MAAVLQQPITGSDATYEASGTAIALHVYDINPSAGGATGSESFNKVLSGATWINETEFRDVIVSGTTAVSGNVLVSGTVTNVGSVAITNSPNVLLGSTAIHGTTSVSGNVLVSGTVTNVGSVAITNVPNVLLGSTAIHGDVNVTQDSTTRQITAGSIIVTKQTNWDAVGSVYNINGGAGSVTLYDESGVAFYFTDPNTIGIVGSVNIGAPSTIGSYTGQANGSVAITNVPNVLLGSTAIHGDVNVTQDSTVRQISAGSVIVTAGSIYVNSPATIGSYTAQALGSVAITNVPNVLLGSVALHGVGSQLITNQPTVDIGSTPTSSDSSTGSMWVTTTTTTIIGSNANRTGFSLYNNGANDSNVCLAFGNDATTNDYVIAPSTHLSQDGINVFGGDINGIVSAGSEDIRFIEFTK